MIRECQANDFSRIYLIINEAAKAYDGFIADDCYHQPYMPEAELEQEMKRVIFYGWEADGELVGVMGVEPIGDVTLIRHAYVLPEYQNRGIGKKLLNHLLYTSGRRPTTAAHTPLVIGDFFSSFALRIALRAAEVHPMTTFGASLSLLFRESSDISALTEEEVQEKLDRGASQSTGKT